MSESDGALDATRAGASWQVSPDAESEAQPEERPATPREVRKGDIEDPNLGDVPRDRQLDPNLDEPAEDS